MNADETSRAADEQPPCLRRSGQMSAIAAGNVLGL